MSKIVEINGAKFEVEDRRVKEIVAYSIGDRVRLLRRVYETAPWEILDGVIVDFLDDEDVPTVTIMHANKYNGEIHFSYINDGNKNEKILPSSDAWEADRDQIEEVLSQNVTKKLSEYRDAQAKQRIFQKYAGMIYNERAKNLTVED